MWDGPISLALDQTALYLWPSSRRRNRFEERIWKNDRFAGAFSARRRLRERIGKQFEIAATELSLPWPAAIWSGAAVLSLSARPRLLFRLFPRLLELTRN